ncbi:MAG: type IV pilus twitching motility protein PilT [Chloroflexi bacterium]|nr:type IV pilus twitching motility protein PilT [Chloroflexota bacterium]
MGIDDLLRLAVEHRASDLHIKVPSPPMMRVDGSLLAVEGAPAVTAEDVQQMFEQITTELQRQSFQQRWELDFSYTLEAAGRFRVNAAYQRGTIALAFRTIPSDIPNITELGLPEICRTLALKPNGLVLVTGPTGSGKSTTLAAMINYINQSRKCHIVTVEDPIEFIHTDKESIIAQREIGSDTTSYVEALKHVLRQDPDVILVGEMRDLETVSTAITAAETGHLVLATLHTNSATQTIDRIIDVFSPEQQQQIRLQLSVVLEGIVTQALLPKASKTGRVVAMEILVITSAVRNLIREAKTFQIPNVMQMGTQFGSQTMDQSLKSLVERRLVDLNVALDHATNQEELQRQLGAAVSGLR